MNEHAYAFQISAPGIRDVAVVKSNHGGPVLFKISESEGCKMARSARHKRSLKRDIKRGFIPMPRKKNAQNPRERIRPYSDMDRGDRKQWWTNGEPV